MRRFRRALSSAAGSLASGWAVLALLAAFATGYVAHRLHVPLAWILGPLLATAIASIAGIPIFAPLAGRRFGQITIGASIGLNITSAVALLMLTWLPVMSITAILAVLVAGILSVPYGLLSGIDHKTAYYAIMPGGLSEMANLGAAQGARSEPIAVAQALRVALLVCALPPFIIALGIHGTDFSASARPILGWAVTALALGIGLGGVLLAQLCRLNNPWMIGALVAVGAATSFGFIEGHLPSPLYWSGQFLIGISVGARFKQEIVLRLPRVVAASSLFVLVLAILLFGYAALLSHLSGMDLASATLGSSPGGLAEMAITAQTLHLSVGIVTGFHAVRTLIVNGFSTHAYRVLERSGVFSVVRMLIDNEGRGR